MIKKNNPFSKQICMSFSSLQAKKKQKQEKRLYLFTEYILYVYIVAFSPGLCLFSSAM